MGEKKGKKTSLTASHSSVKGQSHQSMLPQER